MSLTQFDALVDFLEEDQQISSTSVTQAGYLDLKNSLVEKEMIQL